VTLFGLFLTPIFYVLMRALTRNRPLVQHGKGMHFDDAAAPAPHPAE